MPPAAVLTRDLRSTTAQLRTVGGYVWHLATRLLSAPASGLDADQRLDLKVIMSELRGFGASVGRVEGTWRRRLSDLSGPSDSQGEFAFLDLKGAIDRVIRDDRGLRTASGLVPDHRTAAGLVDVADELRDDLADAADHLKAASAVARRLAGTSALSRRTAERGMRIPQPYVDGTYLIADPVQEFAGPVR